MLDLKSQIGPAHFPAGNYSRQFTEIAPPMLSVIAVCYTTSIGEAQGSSMESEKDRDLRMRLAEREHDRDMKGLELHTKQIESFSIAAMRAPALVAAGGVAASLGFYSANYAHLAGKPEALSQFNAALSYMLYGLLFTLLAPGLAYFSQLAYVDSVSNREHTWEYPFSIPNRRSKVAGVIGDIFRWASVLAVILSIAAVGLGGVKFLDLVSSL